MQIYAVQLFVFSSNIFQSLFWGDFVWSLEELEHCFSFLYRLWLAVNVLTVPADHSTTLRVGNASSVNPGLTRMRLDRWHANRALSVQAGRVSPRPLVPDLWRIAKRGVQQAGTLMRRMRCVGPVGTGTTNLRKESSPASAVTVDSPHAPRRPCLPQSAGRSASQACSLDRLDRVSPVLVELTAPRAFTLPVSAVQLTVPLWDLVPLQLRNAHCPSVLLAPSCPT